MVAPILHFSRILVPLKKHCYITVHCPQHWQNSSFRATNIWWKKNSQISGCYNFAQNNFWIENLGISNTYDGWNVHFCGLLFEKNELARFFVDKPTSHKSWNIIKMSPFREKSTGLDSESLVCSCEITQRARECYVFGLETIQSHISNEKSNWR